MHKKLSLICPFFALLFAANTSKAQTTLWLLNGQKLIISDYKLDTTDSSNAILFYSTDKGKSKSLSTDYIFSVTPANATEQVIYNPNTNPDFNWKPDDMRLYLNGKAELYYKHNANGYLYGGIAAGMAGVLIPAINADYGDGGIYLPIGVIVPVAYIITAGNITLTPEQIKKKYPGLPDSEYYLIGAQEGIEKKQLKKSLIGVGIGLLAGFATYPFIY
jgi:hypothetical protein